MLTPEHRLHYAAMALHSDSDDPDLARLLAVDAHGSLAALSQQMWSVLEPGNHLDWAWFHDVICQELEGVTRAYMRGERRRLVICLPPGCMKSLLTSVFWPAWWWLRDPTMRFLTLASTTKLAERDSRRMRDVVTSELYRSHVNVIAKLDDTDPWYMSRHQASVIDFANSTKGARQTFSTSGSVTGHRGDGLIVDDPHQLNELSGNPEQVSAALGRAHYKVEVALPSRLNDQRKAFEVVIQQRVHEDDVAGRRLREDDPALRKIVLSAHYDPEDPHNHPDDPRTEAGELLDPVRLPEPILARLMARLDAESPGQGSAQYDQRPVPSTGGMFLRDWMRQRYTFDFQRPPRPFTEKVVTIDATFKRTKRADYVSIQAWGRYGWTEFYLGDELHARMSYTELRAATRDFILKHNPRVVLIEEKANGAALIDDLRHEFPAVLPFVPDKYGDKVSRAQVVTAYFQAGNVWLPSRAPWVGDWVGELTSFPAGLHDDRVDSMSQLLIWWGERSRTRDFSARTAALDKIAEIAGKGI